MVCSPPSLILHASWPSKLSTLRGPTPAVFPTRPRSSTSSATMLRRHCMTSALTLPLNLFQLSLSLKCPPTPIPGLSSGARIPAPGTWLAHPVGPGSTPPPTWYRPTLDFPAFWESDAWFCTGIGCAPVGIAAATRAAVAEPCLRLRKCVALYLLAVHGLHSCGRARRASFGTESDRGGEQSGRGAVLRRR